MKKLFFIFFLVACFAFSDAQAQCAVYFEEETGAWGAQWDNGKPPYATMDQVKEAAKKKCEEVGGKNCQLLYSGYQTGWWVVIRGRVYQNNKDGHMCKVILVPGENTPEVQAAAEKAAIKSFIDDGGIRPTSSEDVKSWYVPGKQE
jgi:hypothetical protein